MLLGFYTSERGMGAAQRVLDRYAERRRLAERAETAERCRELVQEFLQDLETGRQNNARRTEARRGEGVQERAAASEDVRESKPVNGNGNNNQQAPYDIRRSFAQQVKDAISGKMPEGNSIIVGRAPKVFQDIGLGALPLTMTWRHANTIFYGTPAQAMQANQAFQASKKKNEHYHGMGNKIYDMPRKLADPIAIIKSSTYPDSSVVIIVDETDNKKEKKNNYKGNDVIGAITIGTTGKINGYIIDTDRIGSYYGRDGNRVIKDFTDALINESANNPQVLYIDIQKAKNFLTKRATTTPRKGSTLKAALQRGRNSSNITIQQNQNAVNQNAAAAAVNLQNKIQKALIAVNGMKVDGNGVLHRVSEIARNGLVKETITDTRQFRHFFGSSKTVDADGEPLVLYTGANTVQAGNGDAVSGVRLMLDQQDDGNGQEAVYASIRNPLQVADSDELQRYLNQDAKYRQLVADGKDQKARRRATAFLRSRSFDGVHLLDDGSGAETWFAFAENQVKSATDNVGTFDKRVDDRRYSRPDVAEDGQDADAGGESDSEADIAENVQRAMTVFEASKPVYENQYGLDIDSVAAIFMRNKRGIIRVLI